MSDVKVYENDICVEFGMHEFYTIALKPKWGKESNCGGKVTLEA